MWSPVISRIAGGAGGFPQAPLNSPSEATSSGRRNLPKGTPAHMKRTTKAKSAEARGENQQTVRLYILRPPPKKSWRQNAMRLPKLNKRSNQNFQRKRHETGAAEVCLRRLQTPPKPEVGDRTGNNPLRPRFGLCFLLGVWGLVFLTVPSIIFMDYL